MIIWDLFGGGMNSLTKALADTDDEIYTFDILDNFETTNILDLSGDIQNIIEKLEKFPKPDIIVASPPCTSFSIASAMAGGNGSYKGKDFQIMRTYNELKESRYNEFSKSQDSWIGMKCIYNTLWIIDYFKPKAWYIENPLSSRIWKYIKYNLGWNIPFKNKCSYGDYGFPFQKNTIFASNKKMDLKFKIKAGYPNFKHSKAGIERSEIPNELLKDIINKLKGEIK